MTSGKSVVIPNTSVAIPNVSEIIKRGGVNFDAAFVGYSPSGHAYVRMEMNLPWPDGTKYNDMNDYRQEFQDRATELQKGFDFAINGLREPHEKFAIEVPVSHGYDGKNQTNISVFVWEPGVAEDPQHPVPPYKSEAIKSFLDSNQKQILHRLKEYYSQKAIQSI